MESISNTTMGMVFFGIIIASFIEVIIFAFLRFVMFYTIVREGTGQVFVLFGEAIHSELEPGLHLLWDKLSWKAPLFYLLGGKVHTIDLRLDQKYLRSQPVNSEEGAPMGVGVWYEFVVKNPIAYLFENADPEGSLAANISSSTVRCLSNLPLSEMLQNRHKLSWTVRGEVTFKSSEWGYKIGSVYIRKVHFRDENMIREIQAKVVNRLRQVTAAINQEGENQVHVITNSAQRTAAIEFAKAAALRPQLLGKVLSEIAQDTDVVQSLFDVLEVQKIIENKDTQIIMVPKNNPEVKNLVSALEV